MDGGLEISRRLEYSTQVDVLQAAVSALTTVKDFDQALVIADETVAASQRGRISVSASASRDYPPEVAVLITVSGGLAADGQWQRALDVAKRLTSPRARAEAMGRIAILQKKANLPGDAAKLVSNMMREVRLGDATRDRDRVLAQAGELCISARNWQRVSEIAAEIRSPASRGRLCFQAAVALTELSDLDAAEKFCRGIEVPATQAECLLAIAQNMHSEGNMPNSTADNSAISDVLKRARTVVMNDENRVERARVLRAIALAFGKLPTEASREAFGTMRAAVEALNGLRFSIVPSPWCDAAVAYTRLGLWDIAIQIATGLADHAPDDGCITLCKLAETAANDGDSERAKLLLARAKAKVSNIRLPPIRTGVLGTIAGEYARIGMINGAKEEEPIDDQTDARPKIAKALLESGRVTDALAIIDGFETRDINRGAYGLVDALLTTGHIEVARRIINGIADPGTKAYRLAPLSRHLIARGSHGDACDMINAAYALERSPSLARQKAQMLAEAGNIEALDCFLDEQWGEARTCADLLDLMPLSESLVEREPEAGPIMHDAVHWIEGMNIVKIGPDESGGHQ